jgi:hypothetical protein
MYTVKPPQDKKDKKERVVPSWKDAFQSVEKPLRPKDSEGKIV